MRSASRLKPDSWDLSPRSAPRRRKFPRHGDAIWLAAPSSEMPGLPSLSILSKENHDLHPLNTDARIWCGAHLSIEPRRSGWDQIRPVEHSSKPLPPPNCRLNSSWLVLSYD